MGNGYMGMGVGNFEEGYSGDQHLRFLLCRCLVPRQNTCSAGWKNGYQNIFGKVIPIATNFIPVRIICRMIPKGRFSKRYN